VITQCCADRRWLPLLLAPTNRCPVPLFYSCRPVMVRAKDTPSGAHKRGARWASLSLKKPRLIDLLAKMCERKGGLHTIPKISIAFSNTLQSKLVSYTPTVFFMLGWPCIICEYFVTFPTWYTFFIFLIYLQFSSYNFLYMFRTGWSIIRRIKLHAQPLVPFPRSLLSRAWPLVLTKWLT